ncbi:MAG: GNAT family N-acetyltransferase [Gemmatimonadaceae bacterium]
MRRATRADAAILTRLRYEFRAPLGENVESDQAFSRRCEDWMRARLGDESPWRVLIAESTGNVVGVVWLQLVEKLPNPVDESEWHGYVSNLFVRDAARNQGVGSLLLRAALDECARADVASVFLWPTPRSRALYSRHGFAAAGSMFVSHCSRATDTRRK